VVSNSVPCKNGTGIPPRFGRQDSRYLPGFLPGFLAGGGIPGRIPAGILLGFLAGGEIPGGQNLGGIPAESCRESWWEAGSRRPNSQQDSGGSLAGILGGRRDSRRPKSRQDPGGSLAGILGG